MSLHQQVSQMASRLHDAKAAEVSSQRVFPNAPHTLASVHKTQARIIAFYLPQFHAIPENDLWWGKGFTEWRNVTNATPLFRRHYQPQLPADLGFYDLRLPEVRTLQVELAEEYTIEGFCYWHYWFNGKRLLERPFEEVLISGRPQFPFCLAWANETWSKRWIGEERDVLQAQTYSLQDDQAHAQWLLRVFADPRNIRVQGRPLFLVYRPLDLPEPLRTTQLLRETCVKNGLPEPYLLGVNAHCAHLDCRTIGFDGTLNFEPQLGVLPDCFKEGVRLRRIIRNLTLGVWNPRLKIYKYAAARKAMTKNKQHPVYPCIFVGWDNSARRGREGVIIVDSVPDEFEKGLQEMMRSVVHKPFDDRLLFVNAWNEWAEGNHLEPDLKYGHKYLEAVKRVNAR